MTRKSSLIIVVALFASAIIISSCDNDAITNKADKTQQRRRTAPTNNRVTDPETTKAIEELDYKIYDDGVTLGIHTAAKTAIRKVADIVPATSLAKTKADVLKALTTGTEEEKDTAQEEADDAQKKLKLAVQDAIASIDKARLLVASDTTNEADKAVYTALEALRKAVVKTATDLQITVVSGPAQKTAVQITTDELEGAREWLRKITEVDEVAKAQTITDAIEEVRTKKDATGVTEGILNAVESAARGVEALKWSTPWAKKFADELVNALTTEGTTEETKRRARELAGNEKDGLVSSLRYKITNIDKARLLIASDANEADKAVYTALEALRTEVVKIANVVNVDLGAKPTQKTAVQITRDKLKVAREWVRKIKQVKKTAEGSMKATMQAVRAKAELQGVTMGLKIEAKRAADQTNIIITSITYATPDTDAFIRALTTNGTTEEAKSRARVRASREQEKMLRNTSNAVQLVDNARLRVLSDTTNEADKAVYAALVALRKELVKIAQVVNIRVATEAAQKTGDRINVERLRVAKTRASKLLAADKIAKNAATTAAIQEVKTKAAATGVTPFIKDKAEKAERDATTLLAEIEDTKTKTDALVKELTTNGTTEEAKNTAHEKSNNAYGRISIDIIVRTVDIAMALVVSGTTNTADENLYKALETLRLKLVDIAGAMNQGVSYKPARKTVTERLKAAQDWASKITAADKIAKAKATTDALGAVRDKAAPMGVTPDIKKAAENAAKEADLLVKNIADAKTKTDALVTALTTTGTTEEEKIIAQNESDSLERNIKFSLVINSVDTAMLLVASDTTKMADMAVYTALEALRLKLVEIRTELDIDTQISPPQLTADTLGERRLDNIKPLAAQIAERVNDELVNKSQILADMIYKKAKGTDPESGLEVDTKEVKAKRLIVSTLVTDVNNAAGIQGVTSAVKTWVEAAKGLINDAEEMRFEQDIATVIANAKTAANDTIPLIKAAKTAASEAKDAVFAIENTKDTTGKATAKDKAELAKSKLEEAQKKIGVVEQAVQIVERYENFVQPYNNMLTRLNDAIDEADKSATAQDKAVKDKILLLQTAIKDMSSKIEDTVTQARGANNTINRDLRLTYIVEAATRYITAIDEL